jgi:hypothetical protein
MIRALLATVRLAAALPALALTLALTLGWGAPAGAQAREANLNARRALRLHGDGCPRTARPIGPSQGPLLDGMLGVPRRACLRDELSIAGDAYLIARPADFYGNIRVGARVSGSYVIDRTVELWGSLEVLRWQTILSAISSGYLGLGYLSLGATVRYFEGQERAAVAYARLVLPTTSGLDQRSQPLALEVGTTIEAAVAENFRFHAWASLLGSVGVSDLAPPDPRAGARVGGGVDWVPYEAFSVVLELASGFGYRDALDLLALQGGLRFAFGDTLGLDLGVVWPFAGAEPGLAAAQLALSGRLDGHGPR